MIDSAAALHQLGDRNKEVHAQVSQSGDFTH